MIGIDKFVEKRGQTGAGRLLEMCQSAVARIVTKQRNVIVYESESKPFAAIEIKPVGKNPDSEKLARELYEQLTTAEVQPTEGVSEVNIAC